MTNELTYEQETVRSVFGAYINDLKAYSTKPDRPTFRKLEEVRDKAIKALEQQPSEDAVSRTEAIDKLTKFYNMVLDDNGTKLNIRDIVGTLERLPSVTPTSEDIKEAYLKGYDYGVKDWFKSKTQPCEDAVSRSELLSHDFIITAQNGISHRVIYATRVEEAPPVTPQPSEDCISILNRIMEYTYGMLTAEKYGLQHLIKSMMDEMSGGGEDADSD